MTDAPYYGSSVEYLRREDFTSDESGPIASPRTSEPGPGSLVAVQTDGELSIAGGQLSIPAQSTPAWGDLGARDEDGITRAAGRIVYFKFRRTGGTFGPAFLINSVTTVEFSGANTEHGLYFQNTVNLQKAGATGGTISSYVVGTEYEVAMILRANGAFSLIKGGAFASWTLLYVDASDATATLYPLVTNFNATGLVPTYRVPDLTFTPTPDVSDSFDRADSSSLGSTDGSGAEESGGDGFSWTEQAGNFEIATNKLSHTGASPGGSGWVATVTSSQANFLGQVDMVHGSGSSNSGLAFRYSDDDNFWLASTSESAETFNLFERNGGTYTTRATTAKTINSGTTYSILVMADAQTIRAFVDGGSALNYSAAALNETSVVHGVRFDGAGASADTADNFVIWPRLIGDFPDV